MDNNEKTLLDQAIHDYSVQRLAMIEEACSSATKHGVLVTLPAEVVVLTATEIHLIPPRVEEHPSVPFGEIKFVPEKTK